MLHYKSASKVTGCGPSNLTSISDNPIRRSDQSEAHPAFQPWDKSDRDTKIINPNHVESWGRMRQAAGLPSLSCTCSNIRTSFCLSLQFVNANNNNTGFKQVEPALIKQKEGPGACYASHSMFNI